MCTSQEEVISLMSYPSPADQKTSIFDSMSNSSLWQLYLRFASGIRTDGQTEGIKDDLKSLCADITALIRQRKAYDKNHGKKEARL